MSSKEKKTERVIKKTPLYELFVPANRLQDVSDWLDKYELCSGTAQIWLEQWASNNRDELVKFDMTDGSESPYVQKKDDYAAMRNMRIDKVVDPFIVKDDKKTQMDRNDLVQAIYGPCAKRVVFVDSQQSPDPDKLAKEHDMLRELNKQNVVDMFGYGVEFTVCPIDREMDADDTIDTSEKKEEEPEEEDNDKGAVDLSKLGAHGTNVVKDDRLADKDGIATVYANGMLVRTDADAPFVLFDPRQPNLPPFEHVIYQLFHKSCGPDIRPLILTVPLLPVFVAPSPLHAIFLKRQKKQQPLAVSSFNVMAENYVLMLGCLRNNGAQLDIANSRKGRGRVTGIIGYAKPKEISAFIDKLQAQVKLKTRALLSEIVDAYKSYFATDFTAENMQEKIATLENIANIMHRVTIEIIHLQEDVLIKIFANALKHKMADGTYDDRHELLKTPSHIIGSALVDPVSKHNLGRQTAELMLVREQFANLESPAKRGPDEAPLLPQENDCLVRYGRYIMSTWQRTETDVQKFFKDAANKSKNARSADFDADRGDGSTEDARERLRQMCLQKQSERRKQTKA